MSSGVISFDSARRTRLAAHPNAGAAAPATAGVFTTPDGIDLYYEDSGGDGPVLFYIYGLGCSIRHWKYPMAYFGEAGAAATRHRQIWMDFRGHGRSQAPLPGQRLGIKTIIDDVVALCAHRGVTRATFLGQSMGGSIALQLAHDHPALVAAVVLLTAPGRDPGLHLPMQPLSRHLWRLMIQVNRYAPLAMRLGYAVQRAARDSPALLLPFREFIRATGFNPKLSRTADIDEYIREILNISPNVFYDMAADLAVFDIARLDRPVDCPTLVIAGGLDRVVPLTETHRLVKHLPHGELCVVKHGSHCPHFDDPGYVNRRIDKFLTTHKL